MKNANTTSNALFFAVGGFAGALFIAGAAHAITDTVFRYSTPQTGYVTYQGETFVPRESSTNKSSSLSGGLTTTFSDFFVTPVNLPQGAKVTQLRAYYKTATCIYLLRSKLGDGTGDIPVSKCFNDASGDLVPGAVNTAPIVIDNARYSYAMQVFAAQNGAFFNGRIAYTYNSAGD
jgi:hypothetical protein